eukprot:m.18653 g.18653  ORF g.18653 m.18653 type:complete len:164 (+) comp7924_c0_seq1:1809-2300(+)
MQEYRCLGGSEGEAQQCWLFLNHVCDVMCVASLMCLHMHNLNLNLARTFLITAGCTRFLFFFLCSFPVVTFVEPKATWEFEGEILVLHHPSTISASYQAMVHCGAVRQTASIIRMDKEFIRTGDKTNVVFRFIKNPEFLQVGTRIVFREGRTKAVGTITKLFE